MRNSQGGYPSMSFPDLGCLSGHGLMLQPPRHDQNLQGSEDEFSRCLCPIHWQAPKSWHLLWREFQSLILQNNQQINQIGRLFINFLLIYIESGTVFWPGLVPCSWEVTILTPNLVQTPNGHSVLQPRTSGLKWSSHLSPRSSWDYRRAPPCPAGRVLSKAEVWRTETSQRWTRPCTISYCVLEDIHV